MTARSIYLNTEQIQTLVDKGKVKIPAPLRILLVEGLRLWVRERWSVSYTSGLFTRQECIIGVKYAPQVRYVQGHSQRRRSFPPEDSEKLLRKYDSRYGAWKSPMHMPHWASRFDVEVTSLTSCSVELTLC